MLVQRGDIEKLLTSCINLRTLVCKHFDVEMFTHKPYRFVYNNEYC